MLSTFVSVALLMLAPQDPGAQTRSPAPAADAPVSTSPNAVRAQPAPPPAQPPAPATGDYAYVAECYGSLSGFIDAEAQVRPEVERIERTWAGKLGPTTAEQAMEDYAKIAAQAREDAALLRGALTSAEGASSRTLVASGQAATRSARAKWTMSDTPNLAREWMSWTLPARCLQEAAVLQQRSSLNTALLRSAEQPADVSPPAAVEPAPETSAPN